MIYVYVAVSSAVAITKFFFCLFAGYFPLNPGICVFWAAMDVLMCTASIWHMCTMSMDRYFTLKYPMKYGRNKTKTMVALKITFVWVVSIAICSPLSIYGFIDYSHVYNDGLCVPTIEDFVMYGSVFAFYVPLFIMVLTYVLTIRILCNNQKLMHRIVSNHGNCAQYRKENNGGSQMYNNTFLQPPNFIRCGERSSIDNSVSFRLSIDNTASYRPSIDTSYNPSFIPSMAECIKDITNTDSPEETEKSSVHNEDESEVNQNSGHVEIDQNEQFLNTLESSPMHTVLSVSQPHLPSMGKQEKTLPSSYSRQSLRMPRVSSRLSVLELESVQNFEHLSVGGSLNSMLSQNQWDSTVWSDFEEPEMLDKLSQIEAEMDECLLLEKKCAKSLSLKQRLDSEGGVSFSISTSTEDSDKQTDDCVLLGSNSAVMNIPPVKISAPSGTNSDSSLANSSSSKGELVTISLKPSGCYLYKIHYSKDDSMCSRSVLSLPTKNSLTDDSRSPSCQLSRSQSVRSASTLPKQDSNDSTTPCLPRINRSKQQEHTSDKEYGSTDECLSDGFSGTQSTSTFYAHSPNVAPKFNTHLQGGTGWQSFWKRRNACKVKRTKTNGHVRQIISKRTASNEKKASKVLGIIFAVFVVLWTPFFIMNILSVACKMCIMAMTPAMMSSIVWLGYLSSLANPIIYTMFNTSFRRAFYKILTCKYRDEKRRNRTHDGICLTNATHWGMNNTANTTDRRNTVTVTLRE